MKNNNYLKDKMKCECFECGKIISKDPRKHFNSFDGKVFCSECSHGKKPANDIIKKWLIDDYKKYYTRSDF